MINLKLIFFTVASLLATNSFSRVNFKYSQYKIADREVYYYAANKHFRPKGLVLLFHGNGGNAKNFFNGNAEMERFLNRAVARGFSVLSLNSKFGQF